MKYINLMSLIHASYFHHKYLVVVTLVMLINISFINDTNRAYADSERVIVAPLSVVGDFSQPEQQIIFNRFRSLLNLRYQLISHKIVERINNHGYSSIDLDDCHDEFCVKTVLAFIDQLKVEYQAQDLFLLQIVKNHNQIQFALKHASLNVPEITQKIITDDCFNCTINDLSIKLEELVSKFFLQTPDFELSSQKEIHQGKQTFNEISLQNPEEPLFDSGMTELPSDSSEEDEYQTQEPIFEELPPAAPKLDPYIAARNAYNQQIGEYLIDVTYALQIFRSGMSVLIEVTIEPDGTVSHLKTIQSSGSRDFDETATIALEDVPFEALPKAMRIYSNYVVILQLQNSR